MSLLVGRADRKRPLHLPGQLAAVSEAALTYDQEIVGVPANMFRL